MYGKLINDVLVFAPTDKLMYTNNNKFKLVLNPKRKHYLAAGYKEIEYGRNVVEGEAKELYTENTEFIHIDYVVA